MYSFLIERCSISVAVFCVKLFSLSDGPEPSSSKLLSTAFIENAQHRLKWTAYLEFTHNDEVADLTWDKVYYIKNISQHLIKIFTW